MLNLLSCWLSSRPSQYRVCINWILLNHSNWPYLVSYEHTILPLRGKRKPLMGTQRMFWSSMANSLVLWSKQIGMSHSCCLQRLQTKTFRGDTVQVTVHNQIDGPPEGTALHWHGLLQKNSQWVVSTQAIVSMLTRDTDGWMVSQAFNNVRFHLEEASPILSSQIFMVHRGITLITLLSMRGG